MGWPWAIILPGLNSRFVVCLVQLHSFRKSVEPFQNLINLWRGPVAFGCLRWATKTDSLKRVNVPLVHRCR